MTMTAKQRMTKGERREYRKAVNRFYHTEAGKEMERLYAENARANWFATVYGILLCASLLANAVLAYLYNQ